MIIGTGIDIIEIDRIKAAIIRQSFVERVFTLSEREYCESRGLQKASSYAARFAGKEAVMKAFGTGLAGGSLQDIEIFLNDKGCPYVNLSGKFAALARALGVNSIHISLTHAREYAAAQAILWGGK
ncbi:holo-ACP synthase [Pelosinus sp. IPA-1]|uniref:holo-ACP synthase n=1 Tax=Pelosinus sp. IPA-1 TaxID=3029569 RepID=UPI002554044B|nr:holo-ACP synthase [Pelosinus sp. IPA-1]